MTARVRCRHVILAHATDRGAAAVADALNRRLAPPRQVDRVQPEHLPLASWSHRVDTDGRATTRIALPDGRVFTDADIAVVWNRALALPQPRFARASPKDREYAAAEFQALVLSWLAGLRERAAPNARRWPLLVAQPQAPHWRAAARRCGLAVEGTDAAAPAREVIVAGGLAVGAADEAEATACVDTAHALALPVVAFGFGAPDGRSPRLVQLDAQPPLSDDAQVQAVASHLQAVGSGAAP